MAYIYPQSDLDTPAILTDLMGSFWAGTYEGSGDVESILVSRARLEEQSKINLREAVDATSRSKVPVFHTELWHQLVLKESEMNSDNFSIPKYGEGYYYGPQPNTEVTILYGEPTLKEIFAFPLPRALRAVPFIFNRTDLPTLSWTSGVDFVLEDGWLKLHSNPFELPQLPARNVVEDGVTVDREVALWLFRSQWDKEYIWVHYGHILGVRLPSSEQYKKLVNATMDAIVDGNSVEAVTKIAAAVVDAPIAKKTGETVEVILSDTDSKHVITDSDSYRLPAVADIGNSLGDVLYAGTPVGRAFEVYDPGHESKPSWLAAISIDEALTGEVYRGGLVFLDNNELGVTISEDSGRTRIDLSLFGFDKTIEKFWDDVHAIGVASGTTLANLLDLRPNPTDDPTELSLPSKVNPLNFLLQNVLRNNALILTIRPSEFGPHPLPLASFSVLRRILPPQKTVILIAQLESNEDSLVQAGADSLTPNRWLVEFEEESALNPGSDELLPDGYTDSICW